MKNRLPILFLSFLLFILAVSCVLTIQPVHASITTTRTFLAPTSDGYLYDSGSYFAGYTAVHDNFYGTVDSGGPYTVGGQLLDTGTYDFYIFRSVLHFDTSTIPDGATINGAILSLYIQDDESDTDFNVTIQSSTPSPHNPIQTSDYYYAWYVGNGGSRNTNEISGTGFWNITLSATGLSYISETSYTRLMIRSSNDISNIEPTGNEYVSFNSRDSGEAYAAKLYVTYTVTSGAGGTPTALLHGPYRENGDVYNGIVNVVVTFANNDTQSYTLDGTDAVADDVNVTSDELPVSLFWNCTTDYTKQRTYYFTSGGSFDEIWIYVADTSIEVLNQYYVSITDFAGLTNAYVLATKNVGGYIRTIEKQPLDVFNNMPFWLITYTQYQLQVVSDQGTFTWNLPADVVGTKSFLIDKSMITPSYGGTLFTVNATRVNGTIVNVYYHDPDAVTTSVTTDIQFLSSGAWVTAYSQTDSGSTQNLTWTEADSAVSYVAVVTADYGGTEYTWKLDVPAPVQTDFWGGVFDMFGYWPAPANQLFGMFIIGLFFGIGSWRDVEAISIFAMIIAGFLWAIGMISFPVMGFSLAFMIAIFMFIHKHKETARMPD